MSSHHHFALIEANGLSDRFLAFKRGKAHPFILLGHPEPEEADAYVPVPRVLSGAQLELIEKHLTTQMLNLYGALAQAELTNKACDHAQARAARYAFELKLSKELATLGTIIPNMARLLSAAGFCTLDRFECVLRDAPFGWGERTRAVVLATKARVVLVDVELNFMVLAPLVGQVFRRVWEASPFEEQQRFCETIDLDVVIDEFALNELESAAA